MQTENYFTTTLLAVGKCLQTSRHLQTNYGQLWQSEVWFTRHCKQTSLANNFTYQPPATICQLLAKYRFSPVTGGYWAVTDGL